MSSSRKPSLHQTWEVLARRPFLRLVRLFVDRSFHGGGETESEDLGVGMGLILALLALPSLFYSVFLFDKFSSLLQWLRGQTDFDPLAAAMPDEYFFIVLSMVVTGAVAGWRWDRIFPDRRDFSNLVHLPISTRRIFFANFTAILFLALVLAIDVNAASAVLFPAVVSGAQLSARYLIEFAAIHALVVILASIFSFFAVFGTVGVLMFTLPSFHRVSVYIRSLILLSLLTLLSTSFTVPAFIEHLSQEPHSLIRFLPSVWFLGLCQLLRGKAEGTLAVAGSMAATSLFAIMAIAMAAYALSYRRCFVRIPETLDITPQHARGSSSRLFGLADRWILRTPFQRGGYRFAMKTLLRSERHGLVFGAFLALGAVIASQVLFSAFNGKSSAEAHQPTEALLSIPFILSYCILTGLRVALDVPADLRANWIFRLSLDTGVDHCAPLARRVMLTFVFPWIWAVLLPASAFLWGWRVGAMHSSLAAVWSVLLTDILLLRFRKVPFTCSYPPFHDSAMIIMLGYMFAFYAYATLTPWLEAWAPQDSLRMLIFLPIIAGIAYAIHRLKQETLEVDRKLIFEEKQPVAFEVLGLGQ